MGSKSDTDRAFADLNHALAALGDGAGHETWGPAHVIEGLQRRDHRAQSAFEMAARISFGLMLTRTPARMIHEMRVLAPVLLQLVLDAEEGDGEELAALFKSVTLGSAG